MSPLLKNSAHNFKAGNTANHLDQWGETTGDPWVREMVKGVKINFCQQPAQLRPAVPFRLSPEERQIVTSEVSKLLEKGVIEETVPVQGQVLSNVFLRPKPNGQYRLILDLTDLNKAVEYEHFKMTSLQTALDMTRQDCWMGSVDLKDAYYSVQVAVEHRKYLRFMWEDRLYQFMVLPNGLACAPRVFTKILTPVYANLREEGFECFPYIDDSFVVADTKGKCREAMTRLCQTLDSLGFTIHQEKSNLEPAQSLVFLGFEINSVEMKVKPTQDKKEKLVRAAQDVLTKEWSSIREIAGLIGLMVAYSPAVQYGRAHVKELELEKNIALKQAKGNFDGKMRVSQRARRDIVWWMHNIQEGEKCIGQDSPEITIFTDASTEGWGAHREQTTAGGRWTQEEAQDHINVLELRAILLALKSLVFEKGKHVKVYTDNTTALAYVKNMGGVRSQPCNEIAQMIWEWSEAKAIWLTIAHIPGSQNTLADFMSRNFSDNIEWEISDKNFNRICKMFGKPQVDMFASRLNNKLPCYVSWAPDPGAWEIDAFTLSWTDHFLYLFPPFSLVGRVLRKVLAEKAWAVMVAPDWPSQAWYGTLMSTAHRRIYFRKRKGNLVPWGNPRNGEFMDSCQLVACLFWHES